MGYVGLADSYVSMASLRQLSPQDASGQARESLRKALQLDDSISEAYDTLALLSWRYDWDWAAAERQLRPLRGGCGLVRYATALTSV